MNDPQIALPQTQLIVPENPLPTPRRWIEDLKLSLRKQLLATAGLDWKQYDPTTMTDRDVTNVIAAHEKRERRKARNRKIAGGPSS